VKKSKLNLIIDALLLLCIASIAGIGLLMRNVLVPGYFWGLDRHQWGTIHFVIALVLLALLVLHVVLHWAVIVGIYRKLMPNVKARWITAIILLAITITLAFFSYAVHPVVSEGGRGAGAGQHR